MSEEELRKAKRPWWLLISVLILIVVIVMGWWLNQPRTLPITRVDVQGVPKVYQQQVKQAISPLLNHGLVTQSLDSLVSNLTQVPWIASVRVERRWPNSLLVTVVPQTIVAIWNRDYLLNNYAETFPLTMQIAKQASLPQFHGPQGGALKVYDYYQQFSRALLPINLQINQITLRAGGDWSVVLSNGLKVVLGQQDVLTRLQRFVKVYDKVFASKDKQAKEVDLQYPNGMAVRWRAN